jgi:hypothetical protein
MNMSRKITCSVMAGVAIGAALAVAAPLAPSARADNATATAPFGRGRHIEARAWKEPGNWSPHWATSAWSYHGAALWSVTWIKNTADLYSTGATITVTCSTERRCDATGSLTGNKVTVYWQNGNAYVSDMGGRMVTNGIVVATKVCSSAVGYSQPLGLHSNIATACAGWG